MPYLAAFLMLLQCLSLTAQDLQNGQWIIGGSTAGNGILLDFNTNPVTITAKHTGIKMEGSNSSMCDPNGNLLFYTNGCFIANATGEVMENGDSINAGLIQSIYCPAGGSPYIQGVISVPAPNSDSLFYIFTLDMDDPYFMVPNVLGVAPVHLLYTLVDMSQNNGLGAVIQKGKIAVADTLARGNIQAIRHENATDWWILVPESHSNCYYLTLVTSAGVQPAQKICTGTPWSDQDLQGQSIFTPDGKKYIRFNWGNGLQIYDFDRSTGQLSNQLSIQFADDTFNVSGVAVAPNSRFLYAAIFKKVYQFDLQADDITASKVLIATWDGYTNPSATVFFLATLAPDGKIYIASTSSTRNLHVINKPNCYGSACNLEQHSVELPAYNYISLPGFPQYVNSNLPQSCDTTSSSVIIDNAPINLQVFPNPVSDILYIRPYFTQGSCQLVNAMGQVVFTKPNMPDSIDCSGLPAGIYFLNTVKGKIMVMKW